MHILSPSPAETIVCPRCHTVQYLTFSTICRHCHQSFRFQYLAIPFPARMRSGVPPTIYLAGELGHAIRALRLNRSISCQRFAEQSGNHVNALATIWQRTLISLVNA